ncbi:sulfite exporter TauE/SafE family protein [Rhizobium sp. SSA_523]|uniref:sulfite exporter TauE/SafE family protein n=1 Tax=Rhizobium sp. SSA_523 TaxID=2952477 RepID=UPI0020913AFE|nr:sulfite exporter TauE/SafE family protein [Rhizobium sp. SSA_523]MCO5731958.1 sulfite exporter TauE/SafE family protein [Rhizobium sp. SSA_523]WKC22697.1 sulfite exporter TauE/SafE family protein [Rhizobium sp. SSA_523]
MFGFALPDPVFFAAAIPAVALVGLSKGGLGGAFALMGVPLLALVVSPIDAAAIFLPILIVMDVVALYAWRHHYDRKLFLMFLPGGLLGVAFGWATSALVHPDALRLVIAVSMILFAARYYWQTYGPSSASIVPAKPPRWLPAIGWGTLCGYGSFVAHAGGPPFQIYALPLKLDPKDYTGASVRFFALINAVKVIPYVALGALDTRNLAASVTLLPVALVATIAGAAIVRRLKPDVFYPLAYGLGLLASLKLLWDVIV